MQKGKKISFQAAQLLHSSRRKCCLCPIQMHTERQTESKVPAPTLFTRSYEQRKVASHMHTELAALIPAYSWSFRGGNVYTQYHWDFTVLPSNALTSEIYTWKEMVTERSVTFSHSIFSQINIFLLFPSSFILFLAPPFFLHFPLLLCFSKLNLKPINKAFHFILFDASLLILQQQDRTQ